MCRMSKREKYPVSPVLLMSYRRYDAYLMTRSICFQSLANFYFTDLLLNSFGGLCWLLWHVLGYFIRLSIETVEPPGNRIDEYPFFFIQNRLILWWYSFRQHFAGSVHQSNIHDEQKKEAMKKIDPKSIRDKWINFCFVRRISDNVFGAMELKNASHHHQPSSIEYYLFIQSRCDGIAFNSIKHRTLQIEFWIEKWKINGKCW